MAEETINEAALKELKDAAKEATSGILYAHKIRSAGVVSYDLGTSKHFDPEGDGESIAEVYHEWDAAYFAKANPRMVLALITELETVRAELETAKRERDAMRAALVEAESVAEARLGEWAGVSEAYAPEWTHPYMHISEMAGNALGAQPQAELETVRAERDALRKVAERLWKEVEFTDYRADMLRYRSERAITQAELDGWLALEAWCKSNLTAALNTQPAPVDESEE